MHRKLFSAGCLLAAWLLVVPLANAQTSKLAPSLRNSLASVRVTRGVEADTLLSAFIHLSDTSALSELEELGVRIGVCKGKIATARIPASALEAAGEVAGVKYIDGSAKVRPMLDKALPACNVDQVHAGTDLPQAYTGAGVEVGVVDYGFDYRHPAFFEADSDPSESTLRIATVWEQSWTSGTPPDGYDYGGELSTAARIIDVWGDVTTSSHGTHVLNIAAGADCGNGWGGVAPGATIRLVSYGDVSSDNVEIADGVAYLFDKAKEAGRPCVVNLSLGTEMGPHDGTSTFDALADEMQEEGYIIVGSAGNFGADPIHIMTDGSEEVKSYIDFFNGVSSYYPYGDLDVWGTADKPFDVRLLLVKRSDGTVADSTEWVDAVERDGLTLTHSFSTSASGYVYLSAEVNPLNGKPHVYVSFYCTSLKTAYSFALDIRPGDAGGRVDAWADDSYVRFFDEDYDGFTVGDSDYTVAEIGGTGTRTISVGAFTTRNIFDYTYFGTTYTEASGETMGGISSFSPAGPTIDGRLKPDVVAPGSYIISALDSNDASLSYYMQAGTLESTYITAYWGYMEGTSMASPFVAGTVALWLEANASLTPEDVREVLDYCCSIPDGETDTNHWGRGKIDSYEGLKYILTTLGIQQAEASTSPGFTLRKGTDGNLQIFFSASEDHGRVMLYSLDGRLLRTAGVTKSVGEVTLSTASLPAGTYILRVDGQSVKVAL